MGSIQTSSIPDFRRVPLGRRLLWGATIGFLAGGGAFALREVPPFSTFEAKTLDWRQKLLASRTPGVDQVAVVLLDDYSIEKAREMDSLNFPWPREVYADIARFCLEAGAKAVVFDMLFTDPSRLPGDDKSCAEKVREAGKVSFAAKLDGGEPDPEAETIALAKVRAAVTEWTFPPRPENSRILLPVKELAAAAAGMGMMNVLQDADNTLRYADLLYAYRDTHVVSLPFEAARAILGRGAPCAAAGRELHFAGRRIPLSRDGRMLVRFYGPPRTFTTVTAISVLHSAAAKEEGAPLSVNPGIFKERMVFVGINAAGREDIVPVPVSTTFPGVEFMATACANILGGDFLQELSALQSLGLLLFVGLAGGTVNLGIWRPFLGVGATAAGYCLYVIAALLAFQRGLVLDVFFPGLVLGVVDLTSTLRQYLAEGRMKREVTRAFGQYLSPVVIRGLLKDPELLRLGGEMREITVFFSDLQDFSTFSETMDSRDLVSFLNLYLTRMTDIILERRGLVDKYLGDAIMAFWGAPVPVEDGAVQACLATLEQRAALRELNKRFQAEGKPALHFRAGLNRGPAVVGNMGSARRFNYTAMGDTVNLASRLEGANKLFGTAVLLSDSVYKAACGVIAARRLGRVRVAGRSAPCEVYELVGHKSGLPQDEVVRLETHHEALSLLERGRAVDAARLFGLIRGDGGDPVVELCLAKCHELILGGGNWDGIWVPSGK